MKNISERKVEALLQLQILDLQLSIVMPSDFSFGLDFCVRGCKDFVYFDFRQSVLARQALRSVFADAELRWLSGFVT